MENKDKINNNKNNNIYVHNFNENKNELASSKHQLNNIITYFFYKLHINNIFSLNYVNKC